MFHIFPQSQAVEAPTSRSARIGTLAATPAQGEIGAQIVQAGVAHRAVEWRSEHGVGRQGAHRRARPDGGLEVVFYDGDPLGRGRLIGLHRLPHLKAQSTYDFRALFTPQQCGQRTIYVVAGAGTRHEHTARLEPIDVRGGDCEPTGQPRRDGSSLAVPRRWEVGSANGKVSLRGSSRSAARWILARRP